MLPTTGIDMTKLQIVLFGSAFALLTIITCIIVFGGISWPSGNQGIAGYLDTDVSSDKLKTKAISKAHALIWMGSYGWESAYDVDDTFDATVHLENDGETYTVETAITNGRDRIGVVIQMIYLGGDINALENWGTTDSILVRYPGQDWKRSTLERVLR